MVAKKLMNVQEALQYVENLDASSEDDLSDDEDFISWERLILAPNKEGDRDTDDNSGDEMSLSQTI